MANLSFAFGDCSVQSTNKQDIIDFIYLKQIVERKAFYSVEFENIPYAVDDEKYFSHKIIQENLEPKIKYNKDIDQYMFQVRILGDGRNTFDYNMEIFFTSVFEYEFKTDEQNKLKEKLKDSNFTATFKITDTSEAEDFIAKGQYTSNWINQIPTFQTHKEDVCSCTAKNARKFNYLDDPWDSEYAMDNFEEFKNKLKEKYKETNKEIYKTMISDEEHLYEQLEDTGISVLNDFDEFLDEFESEFSEI